MLHDRFVCTMKMPLGLKYLKGYQGDKPIFDVSIGDFKDFVEEKRPSLTGKDYNIELCTSKPTWRS